MNMDSGQMPPEVAREAMMEQIKKVLPEELKSYFEATEQKHFDPVKGAGSLFTEAKNLQELLERAIKQRGSLDGDDREKLIELGVSPEALMVQCRYLKVETKGELGMAKINELPADTKVKVIRTKPGVPCSLVVESDSFPEVEFGTIVIGPNEKEKEEDPEPSTKEMIWTVHPGLPVRPASEDIWPEGSELSVQEVIAKLGENIYINVKRKEKIEGV